jgi:hypothetical protein
MKRQITKYANDSAVEYSHFIGDRMFMLNIDSAKQRFSFTLAESDIERLEKALAEYRQHYPKAH